MDSLVLHNETIVTVDEDNRIIKNGTVRVDSNGRITAVEPLSADTTPADADWAIVVDDKIVIPGLIDAHRHTDFIAELRTEYPDLRLHTHIYDSPEADSEVEMAGRETDNGDVETENVVVDSDENEVSGGSEVDIGADSSLEAGETEVEGTGAVETADTEIEGGVDIGVETGGVEVDAGDVDVSGENDLTSQRGAGVEIRRRRD